MPAEKERGGDPTPEAAGHHHHHQPTRHQQHPGGYLHRSTAGRVFRDGFRRGAQDALRLAQRQFNDPEVWWVLAQLADRYDDGYELAS